MERGKFMSKDIQEKIDLTVEWLRKKVKDSHTNGLIVGLSGGIDSALVAFLIKKAFPENSLGLIMPCKSSSKDREDALEVVRACNIKYMEMDLSQIHENLYHDILKNMKKVELFDEKKDLKLTDANLRARLRMSTIYCVAGHLNYLVVGTDNAAEIYTGYFTKYGDGGVDILPIAHLKKEEVFQWSRYLGIPQSILDRPPSAGLWEGQTDEGEMGTTYTMVDALLDGKDIPQKDRDVIEGLHRRSEHKRKLPDVPPKF